MRLKSGCLKSDKRLRICLNMRAVRLDEARMVMYIKLSEKMGELMEINAVFIDAKY